MVPNDLLQVLCKSFTFRKEHIKFNSFDYKANKQDHTWFSIDPCFKLLILISMRVIYPK